MRHLEEKIRKVRIEMEGQPEHLIRAAIAELHRLDAAQAMGVKGYHGAEPVVTNNKWQTYKNPALGMALLQTKNGKTQVEVKGSNRDVADRIKQLKEMVHELFVEYPKYAQPINGWVPRIRFDVYQKSKDFCRKLGEEGGERYEKVTVALRYATTGSKAYRDAIEALGL